MDLEWRVEMLELGNDIPFQVLTRLGAHIERGHEQPPVLQPVPEVGDVFGLELEKELSDAPSLRPRLKRDSRARLPNAGARHETERRFEVVTDLLPIEKQVPTIVRIDKTESSRVIAAEPPVVG